MKEWIMVGVRVLALIIVIAVAIGFVNHESSDRAQTNYDNAIMACERANPVREAVILSTRTAAATATKGVKNYRRAAQKILSKPHVESSGAVDCQAAIDHP